jgi:hypothetical protein
MYPLFAPLPRAGCPILRGEFTLSTPEIAQAESSVPDDGVVFYVCCVHSIHCIYASSNTFGGRGWFGAGYRNYAKLSFTKCRRCPEPVQHIASHDLLRNYGDTISTAKLLCFDVAF